MAETIPPHAFAAMRDCMQVIDKVAQGDSSLRLNVMLGLAAALIREVMTCQNGELAIRAASTLINCGTTTWRTRWYPSAAAARSRADTPVVHQNQAVGSAGLGSLPCLAEPMVRRIRAGPP